MPFMNCSLSLLSHSLYLNFVVLTLSLPIHSSADSPEFLRSLPHCNGNIISLCNSLNLSLNKLNSPFTVSHASRYAVVSVCIKCNPSLLNHIYYRYSFCVIYVIVFSSENVFTSILTFWISIYLSFAF